MGAGAEALSGALKALAAGRNLTIGEVEATVTEILSGAGTDVAVSAFLTGMRVKGETADELAGTVRAVRTRSVDQGLVVKPGVLDTCGTGGDGTHTVNVSTAAAVVVAACGVPVAKHGNRAASGNSGSAEVLAELGIAVEAEPAVLSRCLTELGITFLFAPRFHPGLKALATVRKQLPFRTMFNLVGPLVNPARPEFQLVGVSGISQARLMAEALARLGVRKAAVVTGDDGLDEVSTAGTTHVLVVEHGSVTTLEWRPEDFGLACSPVSALRVSGPADSAARISHLLAGEPGPVRDVVVANAAAALWVAGERSLRRAVDRASEAIDDGRGSSLLARWRVMSHEPWPEVS